MAEAEDTSTGQEADLSAESLLQESDASAASTESEGAVPPAGPEGTLSPEDVAGMPGPGIVGRIFGLVARWHPFIFLFIAAGLAVYAWTIYPESDTRTIPPAEMLYNDGLDRLYRVINPDLPLIAATPADEALAARNAFLNLFVFHRADLGKYPQFINPHLLLGEANRLLAEYNPAMADKYYVEAQTAYADAALWETRDDDPANLITYINANFLDNRPLPAMTGETAGDEAIRFLEANDEEIALRRSRRQEYIRFRQAEADIHLGQADLARPILEEIQYRLDNQRRDTLRRLVVDEPGDMAAPRRAFELGQDEYQDVDFLLARAYDELGMQERAKSWYLRYLGAVSGGRRHAFVVERLAGINMDEGKLYHRVNPEQSERAYMAAAGYYEDLSTTPSATREQRDAAVLGLANVYSRLASLVPDTERAGIDDLSQLGRTVRNWLETFSGQALPRRTLNLPQTVGNLFAKPELALPTVATLPNTVGGTILSMAGGALITPHEQSRRFHTLALEYFDRVAVIKDGTEEGDAAAVLAAWESWRLGNKDDMVARFERMLDPLSRPDQILAARLGLATAALDRGDLDRATMLILGGYAHSLPLWFTVTDANWRSIAARLGNPVNRDGQNSWQRVWDTLPEEGTEIAAYAASGRELDDTYVTRFLRALNTMLRRPDFYQPEYFPGGERNQYLAYVLSLDPELLTPQQVLWRNRMLLEEAWPYDLAQRGVRNNIGFTAFPSGMELTPGGMIEESQIRDLLVALARAWSGSADVATTREERYRRLMESNAAY